ncbi:outer membrane beta-barrel family protein [Gangjinia marincola]|uniref:Outer membrane beta-barrel family protein n=1 Tax=Gangjinia marincola TaxID=578463 RepID=A0ABN1MIN5_9FLAO
MTVKIKLFILFLCIASEGVIAQFSIQGTVETSSKQPIAYANIILSNTEDEGVKGTISSETGSFSLENISQGNYVLSASFVGFTSFVSDTLLINKDQSFPTIVLKEDTESLTEVAIYSKRPVITKKVDRLVFTVENTIASVGSTAEILRRTPGVVSAQGNLMIRGEAVSVYFNGRKVQLSADELNNYLENLSGEIIKEIEVITNPPASFEAESGPVLNIITGKSLFPGYKGNINAQATYAVFPKYQIGTSHFYKNEKLNAFFNYNYNPRKEFKEDESFINYQELNGDPIANWNLDFERTTRKRAHNANLMLDYELNNKNTLRFSATGFLNPKMTYDNKTLVDVDVQDGIDYEITTLSNLDHDEQNIALDLSHELSLTSGSLNTNAHYTNYSRDRLQRLNSVYTDGREDVRFNTDAVQDIEIFTAQVDYSKTYGKIAAEAGAKASFIDSRARFDFFDVAPNGTETLSTTNSDDFIYDEEVYAAYISATRDWEKWSAKVGLRAEQTFSTGTSLSTDQDVKLEYLEWFPSAFVQYTINDNHSLSFDYSRRLERPKYQDLNPFAYFINENSFSKGNPFLVPSFANRFNLNYTLKGNYLFDFYYRDNGENILTLPLQNNQAQNLRTDRQNALGSKSWGIDFTHWRSVNDWWFVSTYMSVFHEEETFLATETNNAEVTNEVDGYYGYLANYFTLSKKRNLTAEASIEYMSRFLVGSYQIEPYANLIVGMRKTFWNKQAVLTLAAEDLLGEANSFLISRYLNQDNGFKAVPETRFFRIGFTYNFGNFRLSDNQRAIDKAERDRLSEE